jgi:hypothetical protein
MLPELLEFVDERVLQLVKCRENGIREMLAQMPEDLRGLVQFWTVRWQIERMHVLWPAHLATAMTARTVQDDSDRPLSQLVAQMAQEELQAYSFHGRKPRERRLCPWWVPLRHTARATHTRLARVLWGRAPNGHQRRRSQVIRPKRPSSKATTRCSGGFSRLPKFF